MIEMKHSEKSNVRKMETAVFWSVSERRRCLCCDGLAAAVLLVIHQFAATACADGQLPPWDMARLDRAPSVEHADSYGAEDIHSIFYSGEPFKGKPTKVFAYYGFPEGASSAAPVPGVVCVHGGSGTAFSAWVKIWNRHGFAAIAMDTNGAVPKSPNEDPDNFRHHWAGPLRYGFQNSKDDVRDQWPYHAVADVVLANSLLRSFPEVDKANIGLTGISWGGYLTSLAAGIDSRFRFAVPVYGCGFLDEDSTWTAEINEYGHDLWMQRWDPSSYLSKAAMPTLWVNGTNDKHYHLGPYQRTYRLTKGARYLAIRVRMDHGHGSGWDPPEIYQFAKSAVGKGDPLVSVIGQGKENHDVWVEFKTVQGIGVKRSELVYTTDKGDWFSRDWKTAPAGVQSADNRAVARLPEGSTVYFFNLYDSRDLLSSSEHVEVQAK